MYYALGAGNQQLAVYHGQQVSDTKCGKTGRRVYMYPTEYLTHGVAYTGEMEDVSQVITDANGNKQYRVADHLASLRLLVDAGGATHYDYDPWGEITVVGGSTPTRRAFNDREKDLENGFYNLGVREMDDREGDFTSIDPLWEKSFVHSPYVYADNNPLRLTDPTGKQAVPLLPPSPDPMFELGHAASVLMSNVETADAITRQMSIGPPQEMGIEGGGSVVIGGVIKMGFGDISDRIYRKSLSAALTNSPLDAVRHAYACALTAQVCGAQITISVASMHEWNLLYPDSRQAHDMDRFNNAVGSRIGEDNPKASPKELMNLVMNALRDGKLIVQPITDKSKNENYHNIKDP